MYKKGLCWIRRDLRIHDHHALSMATNQCQSVELIFIFDCTILERLPKKDQRITFIIDSLLELQNMGVRLHVDFGDPVDLIPKWAKKLKVEKVFYNRDYEPKAKRRDSIVEKKLKKDRIEVGNFKDHVVFEGKDILKNDGTPYRVFTPYKTRWLEAFYADAVQASAYKIKLENLKGERQTPKKKSENEIYKMIGFEKTSPHFLGGTKAGRLALKKFSKIITNYHKDRDFPYKEGTSNISVHLRFGTISIREAIRLVICSDGEGSQTWLSELIWREFYQMILENFPKVEKESFSLKYKNIDWVGNHKNLKKWQEGRTGFPIVDAAMRCLNETGTMPNRLRMVTASFLCKTLLIDWKKGEKYFAEKLLDFDLAANNGGWQWCASTGCDAQPYFRIFNPWSQSKKFDPKGEFIRAYLPELVNVSEKDIHMPHQMNPLEQNIVGCIINKDYPEPIVDYKFNRERALKMYKGVSIG